MATPEPDRWHSTTGPGPAAQTPNGRAAAPEASDGKHGAAQVNLLEQILSWENMLLAWKRVKANSRSYTQLLELDQWLRRRVRLCYWKQWKRPRTRRRHLMALGISKDDVKLASRSWKGYWRMAGNSIVQRALTKQWLWDQGVPNMRQQWVDLHYLVPSGAG